MPLTELQLPQKHDFYRDVKTLANEIARDMQRFQDAAEFINKITATDLDAMQVPTGQVRTDLVDLKNVLNELVSYFNGNAVTPVKNPSEVVDKLRSMLIT